MVSELDCWMEWIENQMAEEMYDVPTEDDMDDFIGGMVFNEGNHTLIYVNRLGGLKVFLLNKMGNSPLCETVSQNCIFIS